MRTTVCARCGAEVSRRRTVYVPAAGGRVCREHEGAEPVRPEKAARQALAEDKARARWLVGAASALLSVGASRGEIARKLAGGIEPLSDAERLAGRAAAPVEDPEHLDALASWLLARPDLMPECVVEARRRL